MTDEARIEYVISLYNQKKYKDALNHVKPLIAKDSPAALNFLAICYQEGTGVKQDEAKAVELFTKGAYQGDTVSQRQLAQCYATGRGVIQNYQVAIKWYKYASDRGDVESQYTLGRMYERGKGVHQDYHIAVTMYKKAAYNGHHDARLALKRLGVM